MSDDAPDISSPIVGGPLEDDTSSPPRPTIDEGLGAAASNAWLQNPLGAGPQASDRTLGEATDLFNQGTNDQAPGAPSNAPAPTVSADDANAAAKKAGAQLTPFTAPVYQASLDAMIANQTKRQQSADVISRTSGVINTLGQFGVGALVSLADPLNDMAMMIPGAPEAWTARAIEELGGGILARTAVRAGSGALQGAAGMAALQPLAAAQASQDHEDFSWGDALRNVAFGAALGTAGGALHGVLSRAAPETTEAVMKAALARVLTDDPRGVDVGAILDRETAMQAYVAASNARENARVQASPMLREAAAMRAEAGAIPRQGSIDPVARARIDAAMEEMTRPGAAPSPARMAELEAEVQSMQEGGAPTSALEQARTEAQWRGLVLAANKAEQNAADLMDKAGQSARAAASRAMNPTDPELAQTQRAAAQTIDTAPKLEGIDTSKDTAEASAMLADKKAEYDATLQIPPVREGYVRMYHGGQPVDGEVGVRGGRWITENLGRARAYADRSDSAQVHYVDMRRDDPRLMEAADASGTGMQAPIADFNAEPDLAAQLKMFEPPKSLTEAGKVHEDYGKAVDAYGKTCAFGGG